MDYAKREAIFSKDALSNGDFMDLFDVSKSEASKIMSEMKRVVGDRLGVQGKIHVEDYFSFFQIRDRTRYFRTPDRKETEAY